MGFRLCGLARVHASRSCSLLSSSTMPRSAAATVVAAKAGSLFGCHALAAAATSVVVAASVAAVNAWAVAPHQRRRSRRSDLAQLGRALSPSSRWRWNLPSLDAAAALSRHKAPGHIEHFLQELRGAHRQSSASEEIGSTCRRRNMSRASAFSSIARGRVALHRAVE